MRFTFVTRTFGNVERNSHCDVLRITPVRVARLFLDCNGVFAIKAYSAIPTASLLMALCLGDRIYMYCMVHYVICDYILNCVSVFVFTHNLVLLAYIVSCTITHHGVRGNGNICIVNIVSSDDN